MLVALDLIYKLHLNILYFKKDCVTTDVWHLDFIDFLLGGCLCEDVRCPEIDF